MVNADKLVIHTNTRGSPNESKTFLLGRTVEINIKYGLEFTTLLRQKGFVEYISVSCP
jgi:lipocalin